MGVIVGKNFNIDTLVSGGFVACPTLTAIITAASPTDQAALASELNAILNADPTPGPVVAEELELDIGTKTAAATAGAATLSKSSGVITSEAITTAAGADYILTLTNTKIELGDIVLPNVALGTSTQGEPCVTMVKVTAGQVVINVRNLHATLAFNGTILIGYAVFKAGTPV